MNFVFRRTASAKKYAYSARQRLSQRGMAIAAWSRVVISTVEKEQDRPGQEEREGPYSGERTLPGQYGGRRNSVQPVGGPGVGEVTGRLRHVGAEHITLEDGIVLGLPWFLKVQKSEVLKVGTTLTMKYEKRDEATVVAFVEVSGNRGPAPERQYGAFARALLMALDDRARRPALSSR